MLLDGNTKLKCNSENVVYLGSSWASERAASVRSSRGRSAHTNSRLPK